MGAGNYQTKATTGTLKFLCSYDGKILIRHTDGELRYIGGHTRVHSVDPSISFSELMVKLAELCGHYVTLRCQLPDGDLETLITIKSQEELADLIPRVRSCFFSSRPYKIRAILSSPKPRKKVSPAQSTTTTGLRLAAEAVLFSDGSWDSERSRKTVLLSLPSPANSLPDSLSASPAAPSISCSSLHLIAMPIRFRYQNPRVRRGSSSHCS